MESGRVIRERYSPSSKKVENGRFGSRHRDLFDRALFRGLGGSPTNNLSSVAETPAGHMVEADLHH